MNLLLQESDDEDRKTREKQERIEASIRKREEEVQRSLSSSLREREKEREQHKKDEAIQLFNALLVDLVCLPFKYHLEIAESSFSVLSGESYTCIRSTNNVYINCITSLHYHAVDIKYVWPPVSRNKNYSA